MLNFKILFLFIVLFFVSFTSAKQFSYGLTMGINNATCDFQEDPGFIPKARNGFVGGPSAEYRLYDFFFLDMGLNYDKRGYFYSKTKTTTLIKLNYLSLPIAVKYKREINKVSPYISLSILPAFLIHSSEMVRSEDSLGNDVALEKNIGGFSHTDYGVEGYLGCEYRAIDVKPFIQFGYYYGLWDIFVSDTYQIKNRSIKLILGVRL